MGSLFAGIFGALKGLLSSKKFWTTVLTCASQAVVKDADMRHALLQAGSVLVVGQGVADFGSKRAAKP